MRLITVLNRCTEFKRFVIEESRFNADGRIMVNLRSRKNSRGESSCCGQLSPTYDTSSDARLFELYDLESDPWEHDDLSCRPEHQDTLSDLMRKSFDAAIFATPRFAPRAMPF